MEILGKETSSIKFWKLQSTLMRHSDQNNSRNMKALKLSEGEAESQTYFTSQNPQKIPKWIVSVISGTRNRERPLKQELGEYLYSFSSSGP